MRESRSYGSVRGVAGDRYPYRDSDIFLWPEPVQPRLRIGESVKEQSSRTVPPVT